MRHIFAKVCILFLYVGGLSLILIESNYIPQKASGYITVDGTFIKTPESDYTQLVVHSLPFILCMAGIGILIVGIAIHAYIIYIERDNHIIQVHPQVVAVVALEPKQESKQEPKPSIGRNPMRGAAIQFIPGDIV